MKINIIGCGLSGITSAILLKEQGHDVEIFETRYHIGGNCYDEKAEDITVHKYGSHIFHTNDEEVWNFLNRYTSFNDYSHKVRANTSLGLISIPYNNNQTTWKKRSVYHSEALGLLNAEQWRRNLYAPLIQNGSYAKMINCFENDEKIFMYGSKECFRTEPRDHEWAIQNGSAFTKINNILNLPEPKEYNFIAGSIFTVSKNYLDAFFQNKETEIYKIMETQFPKNGTIAHGLERLIGSHVSNLGGKIRLE